MNNCSMNVYNVYDIMQSLVQGTLLCNSCYHLITVHVPLLDVLRSHAF